MDSMPTQDGDTFHARKNKQIRRNCRALMY